MVFEPTRQPTLNGEFMQGTNMADLFTNGLTVSGSIAFFKAFTEILTVDGDSQSPVSLILTDSGAINLVNELDTRGVTLQAFTGDDTITTSQGNDSILGNDGNDAIIAGDGDDTLVGGTGSDQLAGGAGADVFELTGSDDGIDTFSGGTEIDTLRLTGSEVALTRLILNGAASVEVIDFATNTLVGTAANDLFDLSGVGSFIAGGSIDMGDGNDSYQGALAGDDVLGGNGNDTLSGNDGDDTLTGGTGSDSLMGGNGNDVFRLGNAAPGNDTFVGGAGTDRLEFDVGADVSIGRLVLDTAASVEVLDTGGFALSGTLANDFFDLSGVQSYVSGRNIALLDGNDTFTGAQDADVVAGGAGNDALSGLAANDNLNGDAGNDTLDGGTGIDSLKGGLGNDVFVIDEKLDKVIEKSGAGTDTVQIGEMASYQLAKEVENALALGTGPINLKGNELNNDMTGTGADDSLNGGLGSDTMRGGLGNDAYIVDSAADLVVESNNQGLDQVSTKLSAYSLTANVETLIGNANTAQALTGNSEDNTIKSGNGDDRLDGALGDDTLQGGNGNDTYVVDAIGDVIKENGTGGTDTVETDLKSYRLSNNIENLQGTRGGDGQSLKGNDLDNHITAGSGRDTLDGAVGQDTMTGGDGDDLYFVDNSLDQIIELAGEGVDTVKTALARYDLGDNVDNLSSTLTTGAKLNGNDLGNAISGNAGADQIDGGLGADILTGGGGTDSFVFSTALGAGNVDDITDFNAAADTIKLENTGVDMFNTLASGALSATAFKVIGPGGAAVDASDRILYNQSTGALYYDADGSGAGARIQFATVDAGTVLTSADFVII